MSGYSDSIQAACKCDAREAAVVEEWLRVEVPTLDHLTRGQLAAAARRAHRQLKDARVNDPEVAAWFDNPTTRNGG